MPAKRASTTMAQPVSSVNTNSKNNSSATTATPLATVPPVNNSSNGMSRLTPARDLTLGGRGAGAANKKVFAPNLNAVRNKNTNVKTSKDFTQPRSGRGRGARGGATRGRTPGGSANSSLIQTTGVFSEGAGAAHLRKPSNSGTTYSRGGEDVVSTRKRTDRRDDKSNDSKARDLLAESDEDYNSSDNEVDNDKTDLVFKPVMLAEGLWHNQKPATRLETETIQNVNIKQEDSLVTQHLEQMSIQAELEQPPPQYGRYPRSLGSFLDTTTSQLFIMQLPNVLPCVTDDGDEVPSATEQSQSQAEQANSTSGSTNASISTSKSSVLQQLEEGQIGKILRYRSGRVKLLLGDTRFDLDMGLESGFLQELMSIETNREQRSGDMINLGPIQAKLKATPDWVHLFEQQEAATRQQRLTATQSTTALDSK